MAIEIYNNFDLNAAKAIEKRFEFTKVTDAIASGYEYPAGATHYFTEDSTNYPKGLYKFESGAWSLVKTGEDLPANVARFNTTSTSESQVSSITTIIADGRNSRASAVTNISNEEMVTLGYVDAYKNILDAYCSSQSDGSRPLPISLLNSMQFEITNTYHSTQNNKTIVNGKYVFGDYKYTFQYLVSDADADTYGGRSEVIYSRTLDMNTAKGTKCVYINIPVTKVDDVYVVGTVSVGSSKTYNNVISADYYMYALTTATTTTTTKLEDKTGSISYKIADEVQDKTDEIPTSKAVKDYVEAHGGGGSGTTNYDNLSNKPLTKEADGSYSSTTDITLKKGSTDEVKVAEKLATLEQESSKFATTLSSPLVDNTTYKGNFTLSDTLTIPTDTKMGIIIDRATIQSGFAFSGDYVGKTPSVDKTYVIAILNGVWSFSEVQSTPTTTNLNNEE